MTLAIPLVHTQRWVQWQRARDGVETTRLTVQDVRRQVAAAVARAYLTCLAQHRVIEIGQRAVDTARAHHTFARQRFVGGAGNRIDMLRAAQELATSDVQLQTAHGALARAREALGVLLGRSQPVDVVDQWTTPQPPGPEQSFEGLSLRRADLRVLSENVDVARRALRDSWTDFMPFVVGTFQPFVQDPPSLVTPQTGWQAQLIVTLPLYDGGLRYGQARERRVVLDNARTSLQAALRQARSDIRTAFAVMRQADRALAAAREAARLAQETQLLVSKAYEAGATTSLEVVDAARRARDAESAAVVAEDGARQARLDLLIASGRFP